MEQLDRFSDSLLRDDLRKLNSHLSKNRRTLGELLSDPASRVQAASGDLIRMKKAELEELSLSLPTENKCLGKATNRIFEARRPRTRRLHRSGR